MKKLSDKARMYARSYGQPPYGREIEGTAELLLQMADKLDEYEVLEEQGKLLKLPCAVGDTVYVLAECGNIPKQLDGTFYGENGEPGSATGYYCPYENNCPFNDEDFEDCDKYKNRTAIFEDTVCFISCDESGVCVTTDKCAVHSPIGLSVFLTIEKAVDALRKLRETAE